MFIGFVGKTKKYSQIKIIITGGVGTDTNGKTALSIIHRVLSTDKSPKHYDYKVEKVAQGYMHYNGEVLKAGTMVLSFAITTECSTIKSTVVESRGILFRFRHRKLTICLDLLPIMRLLCVDEVKSLRQKFGWMKVAK